MKRIYYAVLAIGLSGCVSTPPTRVTPFPGHDQWMMNESKVYSIGQSGVALTVPAGFVTDYASIPPILGTFATSHGQYSEAATIHDYLYWTQSCTRLQADNIFLIAMKEHGVGAAKGWGIYQAVRAFGQRSWDENANALKAGLPRIVPDNKRNILADSNWSQMQKDLAAAGVHDSIPPKNQPYCKLGDSTEVPLTAVTSAAIQ